MGKKVLKTVLAVVALLVGLSSPKVFLEFPIGLVITIKLISTESGKGKGDRFIFGKRGQIYFSGCKLK
ncbi:MAG TPA: hypothetical protein DD636_03525 [Anaerolineaceae bacterium]|nr:hypothetical protein [Anaerolineaceae bacterium]